MKPVGGEDDEHGGTASRGEGRRAAQRPDRRGRERRHAADVDLAQHVALVRRIASLPGDEIGVPQDRQPVALDAQSLPKLLDPLVRRAVVAQAKHVIEPSRLQVSAIAQRGVSLLAYRVMVRIARLPTERRVLR